MLAKLMALLDLMKSNQGMVIMGALLSLSEALALIPGVKANSIFQAVVNGLSWLKDKLAPKA